MKKLILLSVFLIATILLFNSCSSTASEKTVATTKPAILIAASGTATPVTTTIPSTTTTPPATAAPPTTTTPPSTAAGGLSNVALLGCSDGMNILNGGGISVLNDEFYILDLFVDGKGQVWVASTSGLEVFDGQGWREYELPEGEYSVDVVAVDEEDRVWIGYYEGVSVLDDGQWTSYSSDSFGLGEFAGLIHDMTVDQQGRLWVATASGLAVFNGDSWTAYDETSGLTDDSLETVLVDQQGKIWVGHTYGVDVFDGFNWSYYGDKSDAEPEIKLETLFQTGALAVDNQGYIWAGTFNDGVSVFNGSEWKNYDNEDCLLGSAVQSITCDGQNRVWVGTSLGLTVFDGNNWIHYTKNSSGLLSNRIDSIIVTGTGPSLPQASALEPGSVRGKVVQDGQPVAGATVVICWYVRLIFSGDTPCSGDTYSAVTDENGEFLITGVPSHHYDLAIEVQGDWKKLLGDVIVDGKTQDMGQLEIE